MPGVAPDNVDFVVLSPYHGLLTWQNNQDDGPYQYIKIWENRAGAGYGTEPKYVIPGHKQSKTVGGLDPGINYCYKVLGGWWEPPGETDFSDPEDCEDMYVVLQAPSDIETIVFSDFIEIIFKDNSSDEDVFCIYRQVNGGGWPAQGSPTYTVAANMEYFRDTAITPDNTYQYRVAARENPSNYSGYGTGSVVTALSAPNVPTGPTLSEVTDEEMRFSWTAPAAGDPLTGYKIQISDTGAFGGEEDEYIVAGDVLDFLFKDLASNDQYWVRVCAYNGVGDSSFTSSINDTTDVQYERTEFEIFVRDPNIEPVYIAGIDLKMDLSGFTFTSGNVYEVSIDERGLVFDDVWEDGDALDEESSISTVQGNPGSWWWDASVKKLYVHAKNGTDPDNFFMEGGFTHLIPNRKFDYADVLCTLPPWLSAQSIPGVTQEIKSYYEGSFRLSTGSISFKNTLSKGEHYFDKRFEKFTWIGARLTLYCGKETFSTLAKFKKMFAAYISEKEIEDKEITFSLRDARKELDRSLILNKYWLTDYPDMDEDFEGKEKAKAFGYVEGLAPVPIERYNATENKSAKYHYHDGRSKSVGKVTVNDVEKTKDTDYYVDPQRSIITFDVSQDVDVDDIVLISFTGTVNTADEPVANGAEVFKWILTYEAEVPVAALNMDWIYETKYANTKEESILFYKDTPYEEILKTLEHTTEAYILQDGEARIGLRPQQITVPSKAKYIWNFQSRGHTHHKSMDSLFWKVKVYYGENPQNQEWGIEEATDDEVKWKYGGRNKPLLRELPIYSYFRDPTNAKALATTIIGLLNKTYIEVELPAILFDAFPGDLIPYSRMRFFDTNGTANELTMRLLKVVKNLQTCKTKVTMEKKV